MAYEKREGVAGRVVSEAMECKAIGGCLVVE